MSRPADILAKAVACRATLATAESCTGGMVAAALTDIAGSSAAFECGFITYSNAAKTAMLGVPEATLADFGAVSEEVARAMATGARARAGVSLAVAITGIAGPGGSEFKPEGRVCFATATATSVTSQTIDFGALGRGKVRAAATAKALDLLDAALDSLSPGS